MATYTPNQIARILINEMEQDPDIPTRRFMELVNSKGIYQRQPPYHHFRDVRVELNRQLNVSRALDMASLDGYAK